MVQTCSPTEGRGAVLTALSLSSGVCSSRFQLEFGNEFNRDENSNAGRILEGCQWLQAGRGRILEGFPNGKSSYSEFCYANQI
jgi:hypothetical protein